MTLRPANFPAPSRLQLSRRWFCKALGAGGALLLAGPSAVLSGCGTYAAEEGDAFAPWDFPGNDPSPEVASVHAALLAASPHNTQPWAFVISSGRIDVFADPSRTPGPIDPLGREQHIGLGCAIENLMIAAAELGLAPTLAWLPDASDPAHVAWVTLGKGIATSGSLYTMIAHRHTNRGAYLDGAPPAGLESALRSLIDDDAIEFAFVSGASKAAFRSATIAATQAIVDDTEMNEASHLWWRQTREEIERYRDGLTIDASGLGALMRALGKMSGRPSAEKAGQYWIEGTRGAQTTGFGYCLLSSADRGSREQQLRVGRLYQRMQLWATRENLAMQPLNQMAERQDREQQLGLPSEFGARLASFASQQSSRVQMIFRIGVPWDESLKSPRRPVEWVLR